MATSVARRTILGCAVVTGANAIWFGGSDADANTDAGRSRSNWTPARQTNSATAIGTADTGSSNPLEGQTSLGPPNPTPAPGNARHVLDFRQGDWRDENEGEEDESELDDYFRANAYRSSRICATRIPLRGGDLITCSAGSFCTADNDLQLVGCCRDGNDDCTISTACVNWSPAEFDNEYDTGTMVCPSQKRFCKTYSYVGTGGAVYNGYKMFTCGRSPLQITGVQRFSLFDYEIIATSNITAADPPAATPPLTPTPPDPSLVTIITSDGSVITISDMELPSTPPTTSSDAEPLPLDRITSDSDSPRAGAIAGGVVGGVGGVLLIAGLVLFFLRRRKTKSADGTASRLAQDAAPSATYYPGPQDPPLHPTQYGPLSPPMGQAAPSHSENNGRSRAGPGVAAGASASAAPRVGRRVSRASRALSSYLTVSHRTGGGSGGGEERPVSPMSSNATGSPPGSPQQSHSASGAPELVSPTSTTTMPTIRYNRFNPPPPGGFQPYRPYPGT